jgi:hypothetical protein
MTHGYVLAIILMISVFLSLSYAFAQEPQNVDEQPADAINPEALEPSTTVLDMNVDFLAQDVGARMLEDEYQLIDIIIAEQEYQFPVFVEKAQRPLSMGTIYLIPDATQNGAPFQSLMPLAEEFAALGWNSVIMPAPAVLMAMAEVEGQRAKSEAEAAEQAPTVPATDSTDGAPNNAQTTPDTANAPSTRSTETQANTPTTVTYSAKRQDSLYEAAYHQAFSAYLTLFTQATQKKINYPGYNVIFAQGMSAQATLHAIEQSTGKVPDAVIINNIYLPNLALNKQVPFLVAQSKMPLLDLISTSDNHWSELTRPMRNLEAKINVKAFYRQREISGLNFSSTVHHDIAREAYGWFTYLGW